LKGVEGFGRGLHPGVDNYELRRTRSFFFDKFVIFLINVTGTGKNKGGKNVSKLKKNLLYKKNHWRT